VHCKSHHHYHADRDSTDPLPRRVTRRAQRPGSIIGQSRQTDNGVSEAVKVVVRVIGCVRPRWHWPICTSAFLSAQHFQRLLTSLAVRGAYRRRTNNIAGKKIAVSRRQMVKKIKITSATVVAPYFRRKIAFLRLYYLNDLFRFPIFRTFLRPVNVYFITFSTHIATTASTCV